MQRYGSYSIHKYNDDVVVLWSHDALTITITSLTSSTTLLLLLLTGIAMTRCDVPLLLVMVTRGPRYSHKVTTMTTTSSTHMIRQVWYGTSLATTFLDGLLLGWSYACYHPHKIMAIILSIDEAY